MPSLDRLEGRAVLSAVGPHHALAAEAHGHHAHAEHSQPSGPTATILGTVNAGGYQFTNFDGPNAGTNAGAGTNANGISNAGYSVGFTIDNNGNFANFAVNPLRSAKVQVLNINGSQQAMAFGINRFGVVVGTDGNGHAFTLSHGKLKTFIPNGGTSATAFGINDRGQVVGQFTDAAGQTPGFLLTGRNVVAINAPSGPNTVNAQGVNNRGQVVGFYVGTDGQDHGFMLNTAMGRHRPTTLTGTAVADPVIPNVPGEPGATFVFSQILAVNDNGIAVGYYGDSTTSQHGFLYNTHTGQYTFLDDPAEAFNNGVEVTQITGITNSGEITGFYSDANGVFHAFVATPHM
jgi:probable HAF family extracellular repeat protein